MAIIYPKEEFRLNDSVPFSEREVYNKLRNLSSDYVIFHSVQWVNKHKNQPFTWYENDFLIIHKKLGILVLEVKGGEISFRQGLFIQKNSETGEEVILDEGNDPISQAKRGVYHYRKILDRVIPGICDRIIVEPCVFFPSCSLSNCGSLPLLYEEAKKVILDSNSLTNISNAVQSVYDFYYANDKIGINEDEFKKICDIIAPEFDLIQSPSIIKNELESAFLRLTNQQKGLLDYISEQRVATIQGAAGTGKTLVAIEAAKRFAQDGKKILFLCFNRFLFEHLKFDCPIAKVDYYNINTFVSKFTSVDITVDKIRVKELQKIDLEKLGYQAIVIDEAQDFQNEEIEYFADFAELLEANFLVFYDKNQLLTTEKVPSWIEKSECKLVLTKNCRNTYEIACTSYNVIDVEIKAKIGVIKGAQPTFTFTHKNDLVALGRLIKFFKNDDNGYRDSEITILSLLPEEKSIMKDVNKVDGIQISRVRNNKSVFYTTAKKFKGLESKVIIITDIDESAFNDGAQKRVFYVACSRATHRLALYLSGTDDDIKRIGSSIKDLKFSSRGNILTKTKTYKLDL